METTEEIVEMVRGLRGDLVDCLCTAMSSAECSCCMTWPEDFAEPAADMIERLAESLHLANGCADISMKLRIEAEAERDDALRSARILPTLDCRQTGGRYADIDGNHCPSGKPCQRCSLEAERDDLQVILDRERARGHEHDARVGKLHNKALTLCAKATLENERLRLELRDLNHGHTQAKARVAELEGALTAMRNALEVDAKMSGPHYIIRQRAMRAADEQARAALQGKDDA